MFLISDAQFYRDQSSRLAQNQARLIKSQGASISRRRLDSTADDPAAAATALDLEDRLGRMAADRPAIGQLLLEYDTLDQLLGEACEVVAEALRCAVGARTATQSTSAQQRQIWQQTALGLGARFFQVANGRNQDRYVFAGTVDHAPPFDLAGTYSGNGIVRQVEVDIGTTFPANLPGSEVFTVAGGENVQDALNTLATDVAAGTWQPIGNDIDRLRAARAQISLQRTAFGERRRGLEAIRARLDRQKESYQATLSDIVEVDEITSATQLRQVQIDYERGIKTTADLLRTLELGL